MSFITFSNIIDGNLGDYASSPVHYLGGEMRPHSWVDLRAITHKTNVVVFGGGGLFLDGLEALMKGHLDERKKPSVWAIWGAGLNRDGDYPEWLDQFDLVGVRDEDLRFDHVPCASCFHPAFDHARTIKPTRPYVAYSHYAFQIEIEGVPNKDNNKPFSAFGEVIDFLASGEVILTTSYHGLLWASWLGRRCVLMDSRPNGKKFDLLGPDIHRANLRTFKQKASITPMPLAGILEDARRKNRIFWRQLQNMIEIKLK